eukprot:3583051-Rhodomonas_salina.5
MPDFARYNGGGSHLAPGIDAWYRTAIIHAAGQYREWRNQMQCVSAPVRFVPASLVLVFDSGAKAALKRVVSYH